MKYRCYAFLLLCSTLWIEPVKPEDFWGSLSESNDSNTLRTALPMANLIEGGMDLLGITDEKGLRIPIFPTVCHCYRTHCDCCCPGIPFIVLDLCVDFLYNFREGSFGIEVALGPTIPIPALSGGRRAIFDSIFQPGSNRPLSSFAQSLIRQTATVFTGVVEGVTDSAQNIIKHIKHLPPPFSIIVRHTPILKYEMKDLLHPEFCFGLAGMRACFGFTDPSQHDAIFSGCLGANMDFNGKLLGTANFGCIDFGDLLGNSTKVSQGRNATETE